MYGHKAMSENIMLKKTHILVLFIYLFFFAGCLGRIERWKRCKTQNSKKLVPYISHNCDIYRVGSLATSDGYIQILLGL